MSKKRGATSELNHDNWDQEDPKEDSQDMLSGFAQATPEQLQGRVLRVAKRRSVQTSTPGNSPFSAFSGFGGTTASPQIKPNFSALANSASKNGHVEKTEEKKEEVKVTKDESHGGKKKKVKTQAAKESEDESDSDVPSGCFVSNLKALNIAFSKWISQHVEKDANCYLTPCFRDYEKHLKEIKKLRTSPSNSDVSDDDVKNEDENTSGNDDTASTVKVDDVKVDKLPEKKVESDTKPEKSTAPITCIETKDECETKTSTTVVTSPETKTAENAAANSLFGSATNTKSLFQSSTTPASVFGSFKTSTGSLFGSSSLTDPSKSSFSTGSLTFSFGGSTPPTFQFGSGSLNNAANNAGLSFSALATKVAENQTNESEDAAEDSEEPPKVEFQPVEEEGAVYNIKCKVFVKKESEYKDRGVGMLYLKKATNDKVQLLVRTATTTGQIVLNTLVTSDLRPARQGKNNIQIVCVPTPNEKPAVTLIRVKTGEDADELLSKINEHIR